VRASSQRPYNSRLVSPPRCRAQRVCSEPSAVSAPAGSRSAGPPCLRPRARERRRAPRCRDTRELRAPAGRGRTPGAHHTARTRRNHAHGRRRARGHRHRTCPARNAEGPDEITPRQWWQYSDCGGGAGCETMLLLLEHIMDTAEPIAAAGALPRARPRGARPRGAERAAARSSRRPALLPHPAPPPARGHSVRLPFPICRSRKNLRKKRKEKKISCGKNQI